jgi:hypothetical protein
MRRRMGLGLY